MSQILSTSISFPTLSLYDKKKRKMLGRAPAPPLPHAGRHAGEQPRPRRRKSCLLPELLPPPSCSSPPSSPDTPCPRSMALRSLSVSPPLWPSSSPADHVPERQELGRGEAANRLSLAITVDFSYS
jgi:hypothetical protein